MRNKRKDGNKGQSDSQIMESRAKVYGPASEQMAVIGSIQMELSKYCLERNEGKLSREALAHLASLNQVVVKLVRSVSNRENEDNYQDLRNYTTIAERVKDGNKK